MKRAAPILLLLLMLLQLALAPTPAAASSPEGVAPPRPWYCNDRQMLAFLIQTESFSQPDRAKVAIAQIIKREADNRGITVCALARFTWFVAPYRYAIANPESWTARQWHQIQWWAWEISDAVLAGEYEPVLDDRYMHFDGRSHGAPNEVVIGQIHFRY